MAKPRPTMPAWFAIAPFGRLGHRLGFRWIFPIGTLPMPWHPLLLPLLLFGIAASVLAELVQLVAGSRDVAAQASWHQPLWIAAWLAVPLSLPFVQWLAYALRLQWVQAAMVPAAMVLLAVAVAREVEPLWMAAIPIAFFALHLACTAVSRTQLGRLRRDSAALDAAAPIVLPDAPLLFRGTGGRWIAQTRSHLGRADIYYEDGKGRVWRNCLIAQDEAIALKPLLARAGDKDYRFGDQGEAAALRYPAEPPEGHVTIRAGYRKRAHWLLEGTISQLVIERPGEPALTYCFGRAAPFTWFPGFALFFHMSLSAGGFQRVIGFPRGKPQPIGAGDDHGAVLARLLAPGEPALFPADAARRILIERATRRRDAERASFEALVTEPVGWKQVQFALLSEEPERIAARASEMCTAFIKAREAHETLAVNALARLIAALPDAAYLANRDAILKAVNSKELLVEPRMVNQRGEPMRFYGFGLPSRVPELYIRLADYGEPARRLIEGLGDVARWPAPLAEAKRRLDAGR